MSCAWKPTTRSLVDDILRPTRNPEAGDGGDASSLRHFLGEDLVMDETIYLIGQAEARARGIDGSFGPWWCLNRLRPTPPSLATCVWDNMGPTDLVRCAMYARALGVAYSQSFRDLAWANHCQPNPQLIRPPILRRWLADTFGAPGLPQDGLPHFGTAGAPQDSLPTGAPRFCGLQRALADVVAWLVQHGQPKGIVSYDEQWQATRIQKRATAHGRDPRRHDIMALDAYLVGMVVLGETSEVLRHPGIAAIRAGIAQPELANSLPPEAPLADPALPHSPVPTLGTHLMAYVDWKFSDIPEERLYLALDRYRCMGRLAFDRYLTQAHQVHQRRQRGRVDSNLQKWRRDDLEECLCLLYQSNTLPRDFQGYDFCGSQRAMADAVNFLCRKQRLGKSWREAWEAHVGPALKTRVGRSSSTSTE